MERLGIKAIHRVSGPAWEPIRDKFMTISEQLLAVSPDTYAELTTIYVKFMLTKEPSSPVYAAVWLKSSKSITVGLMLPEDFVDSSLMPPPQKMLYRGLTQYYTVTPNDTIPGKFGKWAKAAFLTASSSK